MSTHCPTCGAPATFTEAESNHVGDWQEEWRFDPEAVIAERIAGLTDDRCGDIFAAVFHAKPIDRGAFMRAALQEALSKEKP